MRLSSTVEMMVWPARRRSRHSVNVLTATILTLVEKTEPETTPARSALRASTSAHYAAFDRSGSVN
jgi:hypothetical protein